MLDPLYTVPMCAVSITFHMVVCAVAFDTASGVRGATIITVHMQEACAVILGDHTSVRYAANTNGHGAFIGVARGWAHTRGSHVP